MEEGGCVPIEDIVDELRNLVLARVQEPDEGYGFDNAIRIKFLFQRPIATARAGSRQERGGSLRQFHESD